MRRLIQGAPPTSAMRSMQNSGESLRLESTQSQSHMEALPSPPGLEMRHEAHSGPHLTVPLNSTGSWGMMESLLRRSARPISLILSPSILMQPPDNSTRRKRAIPREDFPNESEDMQKSSSLANSVKTKLVYSRGQIISFSISIQSLFQRIHSDNI